MQTPPRFFAVVGNGQISLRDGRMIDGCDVVVRFNGAHSCGMHGTRTDVLALGNASEINAWSMNPRAVSAAHTIWSPEAVKPEARSGAEAIRGKPYLVLGWAPDVLAPYATRSGAWASTGIVVIAHIRQAYPEAKIHLFGFSHRGSEVHDWEAEAAFCDALEREGVLIRHQAEDGLLDRLHLRILRALERLRRKRHRRRTRRKLGRAGQTGT